MSEVRTVADVRAVAEQVGMREITYVDGLHGSWWLRDVDLRCSWQTAGLSVGVFATIPGAPADLWRWRVHATAGIERDALAALVRSAVVARKTSGAA